jgi:hypothetical protein
VRCQARFGSALLTRVCGVFKEPSFSVTETRLPHNDIVPFPRAALAAFGLEESLIDTIFVGNEHREIWIASVIARE